MYDKFYAYAITTVNGSKNILVTRIWGNTEDVKKFMLNTTAHTAHADLVIIRPTTNQRAILLEDSGEVCWVDIIEETPL